MIGAVITTVLGFRYGGEKRKETKERVVGLSIAGGIYDSGQAMLSQQTTADALKAVGELNTSIRDLAKATDGLAEHVGHFDETTEREARNRTDDKLDQITETLRRLDRQAAR